MTAVVDVLDQLPPPDMKSAIAYFDDSSEYLGFTISPKPYPTMNIELLIYLLLLPLRFYIHEYKPLIYCEFSKTGRLHFHGIVKVNNNYGKLYLHTSSMQSLYDNSKEFRKVYTEHHIIKMGKGGMINKTIKEMIYKKFKPIVFIKPELQFSAGARRWYDYITKEVDHTKRIIPEWYCIDCDIYKHLCKRTENEYNIISI